MLGFKRMVKLKSLVFGLIFFASLAHAGEQETISFIHFNDIYQLKEHDNSPGFAKLKTMINQYKDARKHSVVTFGGDLVPAAVGRVPIGLKQMMAFLNELPIDIAVPGNHEFDAGANAFLEQLRLSKHLWLNANIIDKKSNKPLMQDVYVQQIGKLKVGFFGLITPYTEFVSSPGDRVKFENYITTAQAKIKQLQAQNVDIIVALTHLSIGQDTKLAKSCQEINLILGGHDHQPYTNMIGDTLIHKSGMNGEFLGVIDLTYDFKKKSIRYQWEMKSPLGVSPDAILQYEILAQEQDFLTQYNKVIATVDQELTSLNRIVRQNESLIGNLVADALRDHFKSDLSLINSGALRGDRVYKKGTEMTMMDVIVEIPFKNRVVEVKMTGAQFKTLVLETMKNSKKTASFPNISGAAITYNAAENQVASILIDGKEIDDKKIYTVATVDYLIRGGDGIEVFKSFANEEDLPGSKIINEVVIEYLQKIKKIAGLTKGRLKYV